MAIKNFVTMKKLLIIFWVIIAAVGCDEGGILNDNDVYIADSLSAAVKKVSVVFEPMTPMYVADDGGLIVVENYVSSSYADKDNYSKQIAKIMPDGSKKSMQLPKLEWSFYGSIPQEIFDNFAPKVRPITNLLKGSDGCFYAYGVEQPQYQNSITSLAVTKFDSDLNVIYDFCVLFPIDDEDHSLRAPYSPKESTPLDNGRFAVFLSSGGGWDIPLEYYAMVIGADGKIENEYKYDSEFSSVMGGTIYSSGDIIFYDYSIWDEYRHVRSFTSQGKFMHEQITTDELSNVTFTGSNTIVTCMDYDGDGYQVPITNGRYYYTDITTDLTSSELRDFNGADSSYFVMGGVNCNGSQILYGYCKESFKKSTYADYQINENDARGFVMQDGEVYTIAGTSSKAILGVWYDGGTYTIYYDELLAAGEWCKVVTIVKTDDLKKLVF